MNREEAQFILGAYRANSEDAHDPQFQEALALVRQDPVLARWFGEQQALDRAFAAKLRSRAIPSDLKARLLLARTTAVCTPSWRRPAWLAAAACFALLLAGAGWQLRRAATAEADARFASFHGAMAATFDMVMLKSRDRMNFDAEQTKRWIAEHGGDNGYVIPPKLAAQGIATCKVVEWQGRHVTLLCFDLAGKHASLFVVDAKDLLGSSFGSAPTLVASGDTTSATWSRDGRIYHLIGNLPKDELLQLL